MSKVWKEKMCGKKREGNFKREKWINVEREKREKKKIWKGKNEG
jgi:hypothetical protein